MKTSQLVENIINELGIGTRSLARLIDASPTTIHRWINEEVIISDEKLQNLKEINLVIHTLAKNAECSPDNIVNALIELKESPLWQGWDNAIQMLSGIDITLQNYPKSLEISSRSFWPLLKFAPMFQEISADKKNLKLLEFNFSTKIVTPFNLM